MEDVGCEGDGAGVACVEDVRPSGVTGMKHGVRRQWWSSSCGLTK